MRCTAACFAVGCVRVFVTCAFVRLEHVWTLMDVCARGICVPMRSVMQAIAEARRLQTEKQV